MYPILESLSGLPEEYLDSLNTDAYEQLALRLVVAREILGLDVEVVAWSESKQLITYTNCNQFPLYFEYWRETSDAPAFPWWCKPPIWRPHEDINQAILCIRELCNIGYRKKIRASLNEVVNYNMDALDMILVPPAKLMAAVEQVLFNVVS